MRKDEFIQATNRHNRRSLVFCLTPIGLAFACVFTYMPFQHRFESYLDSKMTGTVPEILKMLPVAVPVTLAFVAMIPLSRRIEREMGIPCPHCGKPLANFKHIVIASKNCPYCGMTALDENK